MHRLTCCTLLLLLWKERVAGCFEIVGYLLYNADKSIKFYQIMMENSSDNAISQSRQPVSKSSARFLSKLIHFCKRDNLMNKFTPKYITDLLSIARLQEWSMAFARSNNNNIQATKNISKYMVAHSKEHEERKQGNPRLSINALSQHS